ncbi:hypothetical protein ACVW1A_000052 [Bradyrhizobium sp. LB1.3]
MGWTLRLRSADKWKPPWPAVEWQSSCVLDQMCSSRSSRVIARTGRDSRSMIAAFIRSGDAPSDRSQ